MFRFTDVVRGGELVRDVKRKYPETATVFERFGLRLSCYECPIAQAAHQVGVALDDLLVAVNQAIHEGRSVAA